MYLIDGESVAHDVRVIEGTVVACGDVRRLGGITLIHTAISRRELYGELCTVLVHLVHKPGKARRLREVEQEVTTALRLFIFVRHGVGRRIDKAEAALGALKYVRVLLLRHAAVRGVNVPHRCHGDTIFQRNGANLVFFKKL